MSELQLREHIKDIITKESAGRHQGLIADPEVLIADQGPASANEGGDILQEVVGEDISNVFKGKEKSTTMQSRAERDDRVRIVLKV